MPFTDSSGGILLGRLERHSVVNRTKSNYYSTVSLQTACAPRSRCLPETYLPQRLFDEMPFFSGHVLAHFLRSIHSHAALTRFSIKTLPLVARLAHLLSIRLKMFPIVTGRIRNHKDPLCVPAAALSNPARVVSKARAERTRYLRERVIIP